MTNAVTNYLKLYGFIEVACSKHSCHIYIYMLWGFMSKQLSMNLSSGLKTCQLHFQWGAYKEYNGVAFMAPPTKAVSVYHSEKI